MTLYEIDRRIESLADPETGELLDYEAYCSLALDKEVKIENTALLVKNLSAEAAAIKAEIEKLTKRMKAAASRSERLKSYLSMFLKGEKFSTARCAISYRASEALAVIDAHAAAAWLESSGYMDLVTREIPKIDKRAVKWLVDSGSEIPGVTIVSRQAIQVR